MLCYGFDGGFGGVVGWVSGRIRDTLFRSRDDDGFRITAVGLEMREESVDAVDHAEEIHVHDLVEVLVVCPVAFEAYAGVQVEEV